MVSRWPHSVLISASVEKHTAPPDGTTARLICWGLSTNEINSMAGAAAGDAGRPGGWFRLSAHTRQTLSIDAFFAVKTTVKPLIANEWAMMWISVAMYFLAGSAFLASIVYYTLPQPPGSETVVVGESLRGVLLSAVLNGSLLGVLCITRCHSRPEARPSWSVSLYGACSNWEFECYFSHIRTLIHVRLVCWLALHVVPGGLYRAQSLDAFASQAHNRRRRRWRW